MAKIIPDFDLLISNYPDDHDAAAVKREIGDKVDSSMVTNTCVVRVSRAFNYSNDPIPAGYPGLLTLRGADNMRYALRVREFRRYMEREYSEPHIVRNATKRGGVDRGAFMGWRGLICFEVRGWSDATGHFTLWDGTNCAYGDYFTKAHQVCLWSYIIGPGDFPSQGGDTRYA